MPRPKRRDWNQIITDFMASPRKTRRIKMTSPSAAQKQRCRLLENHMGRIDGLVFTFYKINIVTRGATIIITKG